MKERVLLAVNFALDHTYANRDLLADLYADRFDSLWFTISKSCADDPRYCNIIQSWEPPLLESPCTCAAMNDWPHSALTHSFHSRLVDVAWAAGDFDYVLFTEDDCLLSPQLNSSQVVARLRDWEAVTPEIFFCPRIHPHWTWAAHPAGYPRYETVAEEFDMQRLSEHWQQYSRKPLPPVAPPWMFSGFCDWLLLRTSFLRQAAADLTILKHVWHEAAIPTALLHNSARIDKSNGQALWGEERQRSLPELMTLVKKYDFVHPVKFLNLDSAEVRAAYRKLF